MKYLEDVERGVQQGGQQIPSSGTLRHTLLCISALKTPCEVMLLLAKGKKGHKSHRKSLGFMFPCP